MKIKANLKTTPMTTGAPKGHKGYARHIPERIDKVKALNPTKYPHCKNKLSKTQKIKTRHVTDIKLVTKTITTKYDIHRKHCTKCKKNIEQKVPNALPNARFELNIILLIMYPKLGLRLPCSKIYNFIMTIYALKISNDKIIVILRQLTNTFGDYYAHLEKLVKLARVKHTDSTSWQTS